MVADLTLLPFDQYQRYANAGRIVSALDGINRVLEVGANRQRLLGQFLPGRAMTYTDVEPQDEAGDFLVADACALPFDDRSYDAVISLDMLEHVEPAARHRAISEIARVCARVAVIACPIDRPWVRAAEEAADAIWVGHFNSSYPWLAEHKVHGLVDPVEVERVFSEGGLHVIRIPHGDAQLWAALMGAHFAKEIVPELTGVVAALDQHYNRAVFDSDTGEKTYRELIVGVRNREDVRRVDALRTKVAENAEASTVLKAVAQGLLPAIERIRTAETGWRDTAEMWRASQAELAAAKAELALAKAGAVEVESRLREIAVGPVERIRETLEPLLKSANSGVANIQEEVSTIHGELEGVRSQWPDTELREEVRRLNQGLHGLRRLLMIGIAAVLVSTGLLLGMLLTLP